MCQLFYGLPAKLKAEGKKRGGPVGDLVEQAIQDWPVSMALKKLSVLRSNPDESDLASMSFLHMRHSSMNL